MIRQDSDYEDFYIASKEDAERQVENAQEFLAIAKLFLGQEDE